MSYSKLYGDFAKARVIRFTAGSALSAGDVTTVQDRVGVVYEDVANGAVGLLIVETDHKGILMTKAAGATWSVGQRLYWDAGNSAVNTISGSFIGFAAYAAASADVTGRVELRGDLDAGNIVKISETIAYDDFTDGGSTSGTYAMTVGQIPAGAFFLQSLCTALTGFAGDTSAVITIGDGTDVDRYNTGTPDVFTTAANGIALGVPSGVQYHDAAKTVTVTITTAADFTSVSAGSVTLELFYLT
jgi:predicted RecA/RadA family phage recombinase